MSIVINMFQPLTLYMSHEKGSHVYKWSNDIIYSQSHDHACMHDDQTAGLIHYLVIIDCPSTFTAAVTISTSLPISFVRTRMSSYRLEQMELLD